jgi:hypothetical protein
MPESIPLVLLMRNAARNPAGIARAERIAEELGLECTGAGGATVSVRVNPERFRSLFGKAPKRIPGRKRGATDAGSPPGYQEADLPVPEPFRELVESISVVPPATRLGSF